MLSFLIYVFTENVLWNRKGRKLYEKKKDAAQTEVVGDLPFA